ncbi:MAG: Gfo/Idh/MocA family oxidoreductase [Desulfobacula sp.]|jgi:predicted dehydrogenase/threonine dehydrogenase-like Zn-dependent dehydrogenase|uniref:bi-domain-containing oxidoreductase n=1 Tax=Desulfobacula sp. TaxID=2593537 RepID=UPI001DB4F075|nr:Gfo/Idh/MocA family oxidoreductase [Desulfobacula sp.]MBT3487424.1 Gfo/Idh/MocA family oxidoreductase [Desulfobacula sp.]MBT3806952.1 Gfo/Idh/MocA family oxidoreductase [Desulfobacula sp.]MBT4026579.1 Gfo/Idh/MocA family oxidoreductase [Desulfobacula sp.]MBT4201019.1 Gfo/Idh/MocA family oxidoreductase [Desulfobacula sp.]
MHQLSQKLKNGKMIILDVPVPVMNKGHMLVKVYYSLVSAGTESSTVKTARKGLIGKAKERPQQVKQVIDTLKSQGPLQTYRAVMKKLDAYSSLGYSCVGEIVDLSADVVGYQIGDLVACGGLSASHAEIISVPINLSVKLDTETDLKQASYNTLGSIAMQGVRQADLRLGETCAVIGLGLLGQITALLLRASGVKVIGVDIDPAMVEIAGHNCLDLGVQRDSEGIEGKIFEFTGGIGCDGVIITAASSSLDPVNFAGAISRKRGKVVIVGAVPTGFDREPHFYKKELQLKMSCSYGPGRYDPQYEEKGIDYPVAYVRWTEKRNMQAFQELILNGKINVEYLTTHLVKLENAPDVYDIMMSKSELFIGILIEYDRSKTFEKNKIKIGESRTAEAQSCGIGFIGAGSYAQSHLLPNIPKNNKIMFEGVMTSTGVSSRSVAERFGFEFCTEDEKDILLSDRVNTVFIATHHDSHAEFVTKAIENGKNVFVEKPLCLKIEELELITDFVNTNALSCPRLMVGYNRRFSPLGVKLKNCFKGGPMAMSYRINSGNIPADSWIQDMESGGGRIIGEVCHFIDFLTFVNESLPVSVHAFAMQEPQNLNDVVIISLKYANGSIGSISYFSNGDKSISKERVEVFANGVTAVLDDFKRLTIHSNGKKKEEKLLSQNKGQKEEVQLFIKSIIDGKKDLISFEELHNTSLVAFKVLESIQTGNLINL